MHTLLDSPRSDHPTFGTCGSHVVAGVERARVNRRPHRQVFFDERRRSGGLEGPGGGTYQSGLFGEEVVAHYLNQARIEVEAYDAAVTDWERIRGFERL